MGLLFSSRLCGTNRTGASMDEWIPLKALVIDDDNLYAAYLTATLTSVGFDVSTYTDSSQAIQNIRDIRPNLVVCDLVMPGMSGCDVINIIRQTDQGNVIIVAVTGTADDKAQGEAIEAGADDVYIKTMGAGVMRAKFANIAHKILHTERHDRIVIEVKKQLNETVEHIQSCSDDKDARLDALEKRIEMVLDESYQEQIAERAADRAISKLTEDAYKAVGKTITEKAMWFVGLFVVAGTYALIKAGYIKL